MEGGTLILSIRRGPNHTFSLESVRWHLWIIHEIDHIDPSSGLWLRRAGMCTGEKAVVRGA